MYEKINYLLRAAQEILKSSSADDEDVVMAQQNGKFLVAATDCVKAAGECVAKTKFVIERIGDFEFEPESQGFGIHVYGIGADLVDRTRPAPVDTDVSSTEVLHKESLTRATPPPLVIPSYEKPLPEVPAKSPPLNRTARSSEFMSMALALT
jgi:hypothetical protein